MSTKLRPGANSAKACLLQGFLGVDLRHNSSFQILRLPLSSFKSHKKVARCFFLLVKTLQRPKRSRDCSGCSICGPNRTDCTCSVHSLWPGHCPGSPPSSTLLLLVNVDCPFLQTDFFLPGGGGSLTPPICFQLHLCVSAVAFPAFFQAQTDIFWGGGGEGFKSRTLHIRSDLDSSSQNVLPVCTSCRIAARRFVRTSKQTKGQDSTAENVESDGVTTEWVFCMCLSFFLPAYFSVLFIQSFLLFVKLTLPSPISSSCMVPLLTKMFAARCRLFCFIRVFCCVWLCRHFHRSDSCHQVSSVVIFFFLFFGSSSLPLGQTSSCQATSVSVIIPQRSEVFVN